MAFDKTIKLMVLMGLFIMMYSCGSKEEAPKLQAFEMMDNDTINKVDAKGLKQGMWYFFANKGKNAKKDEKPMLLVKGMYQNDLREGVWYYYSPDGTPSDTVSYLNDIPQEN